jgi:hypothetical protein
MFLLIFSHTSTESRMAPPLPCMEKNSLPAGATSGKRTRTYRVNVIGDMPPMLSLAVFGALFQLSGKS